MKLYYDRKSKDPTYFVQMGIRNGKKTTTKNIKRIGRHSELLAITDDPLAYAKKQVERMNKEYREGKIDMSFKVDFSEKLLPGKSTASNSVQLNVGYFILQQIYHDLKISEFFRDIQEKSRVTFNCNDVNRFLTFGRILDPRSKRGTFDRLDRYYEKPDIEYQHILRFLDILAENQISYIEHLYVHSQDIVKRNTSVCYFDCTNYYFEIEQEDTYIDEVTGEILKGLRRYGPSKEHRPNPLVQMGLFMDGNGIPLSMCIHRGSDNEQESVLPLEKELSSMFGNKPFIYCADSGLGAIDTRLYNSMCGRAFIITQSIKKLSGKLQETVFSDCDYRRLSDDSPISMEEMKTFDRFRPENRALYDDQIYKIIDADRAVDVGLREEKVLKNGKTRKVKSKATLKQHIIITFSRKTMEYQRCIRNRQIERAKNLLKNRDPEEIRKGPNDVTRFIKRTSTAKDGEKATDSYELDQSVIEQEEKYDGFYAVATNLEDPAKDILAINSRRHKIEDCFRVLKTNFRARPVFLSRENRITAHFIVCYTALLIYRLLERKLEQYGSHFTTEEILETLKNMDVMNMQDMFYMAAYSGGPVCSALNGIYGLGLDKKYYQPKELNKIIKKISR